MLQAWPGNRVLKWVCVSASEFAICYKAVPHNHLHTNGSCRAYEDMHVRPNTSVVQPKTDLHVCITEIKTYKNLSISKIKTYKDLSGTCTNQQKYGSNYIQQKYWNWLWFSLWSWNPSLLGSLLRVWDLTFIEEAVEHLVHSATVLGMVLTVHAGSSALAFEAPGEAHQFPAVLGNLRFLSFKHHQDCLVVAVAEALEWAVVSIGIEGSSHACSVMRHVVAWVVATCGNSQ